MKELRKQLHLTDYLVSEFEKNLEINSKLIRIQVNRANDFIGYGITFIVMRRSVPKPTDRLIYPLVRVRAGSPAEAAGLIDGHRILAVNGKYVNKDLNDLIDVVKCVEDSFHKDGKTNLLVINPSHWSELIERVKISKKLSLTAKADSSVTSDASSCDSQLVKLRSIELKKQSEYFGYGLVLYAFKALEECPLIDALPDTPAQQAGIVKGDRIFSIDGKVVNKDLNTLEQIFDCIEESFYKRGQLSLCIFSK